MLRGVLLRSRQRPAGYWSALSIRRAYRTDCSSSAVCEIESVRGWTSLDTVSVLLVVGHRLAAIVPGSMGVSGAAAAAAAAAAGSRYQILHAGIDGRSPTLALNA